MVQHWQVHRSYGWVPEYAVLRQSRSATFQMWLCGSVAGYLVTMSATEPLSQLYPELQLSFDGVRDENARRDFDSNSLLQAFS